MTSPQKMIQQYSDKPLAEASRRIAELRYTMFVDQHGKPEPKQESISEEGRSN
jgi:hypothetical protein